MNNLLKNKTALSIGAAALGLAGAAFYYFRRRRNNTAQNGQPYKRSHHLTNAFSKAKQQAS